MSYSDLCDNVKKGDIMGKTGHLFRDRYNSEVVEIKRYLIITVLRYIHRDPVKANMVKKAEDYIWSSYNSYIDSYNKKDA